MSEIDFEKGCWAVLSVSGHGLVIGCITGVINCAAELAKIEDVSRNDMLTLVDPLVIEPCFGFIAQMVPAPSARGMTMQFVRQCTPLAGCLSPPKLIATADSVLLFSDMTEMDRKQHQSMVKEINKQLLETRAAQAGLTLAPAMPPKRN